ncbi:MAG: hypothetical protein K8W52_41900 [Deltaproteobacteria bacterium]|nr:hypothetical protein [Deltaproteobacteria bacterium]
MRSLGLVLIALAACGSSPHPATPPSSTAPADPPAAAAPAGTTGFEQVSWGDPVEHVRALYPAIGEGATLKQPFEGLPATIDFDLSGSVVQAIQIQVDGAYPGMGPCLAAWKDLRKKLDARYGASQAENGAAYWTTATAQVTAACNPDEAGAAELSISFARPAPPDAE